MTYEKANILIVMKTAPDKGTTPDNIMKALNEALNHVSCTAQDVTDDRMDGHANKQHEKQFVNAVIDLYFEAIRAARSYNITGEIWSDRFIEVLEELDR